MEAKRYLPVVRVSFHTEAKCYQVFGKTFDPEEDREPTFQLISVNTSKTLANPAGAFTIQLAGDYWIDRLTAMDMVVISMGYKDDTELDTVMVGLIDTVQRSRKMGDDGTPVITTTVTGRDFGKLLVKTSLKFYPELMNLPASELEKVQKFFLTDVGWVTLMQIFTGEQTIKGTPAVVLDIIMRKILSKLNDVSWTVWDETRDRPVKKTLKMQNIIRYNFAYVNFFLPMILSLSDYEGSIWNLMEKCAIKPFTELFIDVRDSKEAWNSSGNSRVVTSDIEQASNTEKANLPEDQGRYASPAHQFGTDKAKVLLAYRKTPFDKEDWDKLKRHTLHEKDVISEDLTKGDNEHYNLFWAGEKIATLGVDIKRLAPPILNTANALRYGISPLEVNIDGLFRENDPAKESTQTISFTDLAKEYTDRLKRWYENNHELLSGTLEVRGKGSYKVGQRLVYEDIDREFYIEGVNQAFHMLVGWKATLTVTRGAKLIKKDKEAIPDWLVVEDYDKIPDWLVVEDYDKVPNWLITND